VPALDQALLGQQFEGAPQCAQSDTVLGGQAGLGRKGGARGPLTVDDALPEGCRQGAIPALTRLGLNQAQT
jgi:hypothetical protein